MLQAGGERDILSRSEPLIEILEVCRLPFPATRRTRAAIVALILFLLLTTYRYARPRNVASRLPSAWIAPSDAFTLRRWFHGEAFQLPNDLQIVPETSEALQSQYPFFNNPISPFRPRNQFLPYTTRNSPPIIGIVTVISDGDTRQIDDTYESLRRQALQGWIWYIIDDTGNKTVSAHVRRLASSEGRIKGQVHARIQGHVQSLNEALDVLLGHGLPFGTILEPGEMLEPTVLEKAAWSFSSVPSWSLVGFFEILLGAESGVSLKGLHSGSLNYLVVGQV